EAADGLVELIELLLRWGWPGHHTLEIGTSQLAATAHRANHPLQLVQVPCGIWTEAFGEVPDGWEQRVGDRRQTFHRVALHAAASVDEAVQDPANPPVLCGRIGDRDREADGVATTGHEHVARHTHAVETSFWLTKIAIIRFRWRSRGARQPSAPERARRASRRRPGVPVRGPPRRRASGRNCSPESRSPPPP